MINERLQYNAINIHLGNSPEGRQLLRFINIGAKEKGIKPAAYARSILIDYFQHNIPKQILSSKGESK